LISESKNVIKDDQFEFFLPIQKANNTNILKDNKRWIEGIASTEDVDLQGEKVVQSGIQYDYFLAHGFINDDHKPGPEHKVGEPTECRITKAGLWVRAFLYKGQERAEYWWTLIQSLEQSNASRKVGFSIQGKVIRRNGNSILKCWLQDTAITAAPINTHTYVDIVKALSKERWCSHPWRAIEKACKGCPGNACSMMNDKEDEEKALSAGGMGRTLIPQSLEGSAKVQTYKSLPDQVSKRDAIEYLQLTKGYSRATAQVVADAIFMDQKIQ
jgi:hypothetical protein